MSGRVFAPKLEGIRKKPFVEAKHGVDDELERR